MTEYLVLLVILGTLIFCMIVVNSDIIEKYRRTKPNQKRKSIDDGLPSDNDSSGALPFTVKFESGPEREGRRIVYTEGTKSITFPLLPRSNRLFLPNDKLWHELLPSFVSERREEVLPRIVEYCHRFAWLKLSEAQMKDDLGWIIMIERQPLNITYHGNPQNPRYSDPDENQRRFEESRPAI